LGEQPIGTVWGDFGVGTITHTPCPLCVQEYKRLRAAVAALCDALGQAMPADVIKAEEEAEAEERASAVVSAARAFFADEVGE